MIDERDEIRSRINLVDLVSQRVVLKRTGRNFTGLCPFHDDKRPSFTVSPTTGRYRCWSCGAHGDVFNWVMETQKVDFPEALQQLARQAGVTLKQRVQQDHSARAKMLEAMDGALSFFREQFLKSDVAKKYVAEREISNDALSKWEVGYSPDEGTALTVSLQKKGFSLALCKSLFLVDEDSGGGFYDRFRGRLMFPIRDERGDLVAFGGRVLYSGEPKYINSSDTPLYRKSKVLYGLYQSRDTIAKTRSATLCEGYLDVMACHAAGETSAIASLGTALSEDHARLLKRWCDAVTILYDADEAGEKAASRAVEVLRKEGLQVRVALMPKGEDPDTLLRVAGPGAVMQAVKSAGNPTDFRLRSIEARLKPSDPAFWTEVAAALAEAATEMDREAHMTRLAALYPGTRDVVAARRALRAEVVKARKRQRSDDRPSESERVAVDTRERLLIEGLAPAEKVVFRELALGRENELVWQALADADITISEAGARLRMAIVDAFPLKPPSGPAAEWLAEIEDADAAQALADCTMLPELFDVHLEGALAVLRGKLAVVEVKQLIAEPRDDDRLFEIQKRLQKLKGADPK